MASVSMIPLQERASLSAGCGTSGQDGTADRGMALVDTRRVGAFQCRRIAADAGAALPALGGIGEGAMVLLQIGGGMTVMQQGRDAALHAGDVTLIDADEGWSVRQDRRSIFFALALGRQALPDAPINWRTHTAHALPRGSAAVIMALVHTTFEQIASTDAATGTALTTALTSLISSAVAGGSEPLPPSMVPGAVREIQNELLARLNDADLSPRALARRHGLSERQLYRLFERSGISLSRWIRQSRLDRCATDLRNPHLRERSITQIAFGYGFNDAAHFSRTFRSEFGQTPRDYRAAALG